MTDALVKRKFEFIVMGCSVGGIDALKTLLSGLPAEFPIPIGVVQRGPDSNAMMIRYFKDICSLKVVEPEDKEPIVAGTVYFAPANYHMLVGEDLRIHLSVDEAVNYSRPSIDVLFTSAAVAFKQKVVGIVMTGANADGAQGLKDIRELGGWSIVQDPATAVSAVMPEAAIAATQGADQVLDLEKIKQFIHSLVKKGA